MPSPRPPTAYEDAHWLRRGRELLRPGREWVIRGLPGYVVRADGRVYKAAYCDRAGHRRTEKEVLSFTAAGTQHFHFFVGKRRISISQRKLRGLLMRA